jgi:Holliday junction resolvasome RuvABC endonuclease subunit
MIAAQPRSMRTFALHPTSRGFGWVAFEGASTPYSWGTIDAKKDKNASCLHKVEQLLAQFLPETLVLEAFEKGNSSRCDRIGRLCRAIVALAADRGVEVAIYTRDQIRSCFESVGAKTRQEIAAAVVRHVDALRHWLPKTRKVWESEHRHMSVFAAAALVLTHHRLGAQGLFRDLQDATA